MKSRIARVAWLLRTNDQRDLIYATELPAGPRAAFGFSRDSIALRRDLAFLVSGFICYQSTKYLTSPILELRDVSQELAACNFVLQNVTTFGMTSFEIQSAASIRWQTALRPLYVSSAN
jgi:hypothetical protein